MTAHSSIYVGNTSIVELDGLADQDGAFQNDATVTLESLKDRDGTAVGGVTVPLTMNYVTGSDGKYRGTIPPTAEVTAEKVYLATVKAVSTSGKVYEAEETVIAQKRKD